MDRALRDSLIALAREDAETRERLAADGSLFDGYHPEMRAVHDANADQLAAIIDAKGWPGIGRAGDEGAEAAWLVAQHAIARPEFMRRALCNLEAAVAAADAPAWQAAYLTDRIQTLEGRPQLHGTQFDWNEDGLMAPQTIEGEAEVDARRAAVGLPPLAEAVARIRANTGIEQRPADLAARRREMEEWAAEVGWRRS